MMGSMTTWEYRVVALPRFVDPSASTHPSPAVEALNAEGAQGWEAVGMTVLSNGSIAVLLKRSTADT